jgi:hypothetical protein
MAWNAFRTAKSSSTGHTNKTAQGVSDFDVFIKFIPSKLKRAAIQGLRHQEIESSQEAIEPSISSEKRTPRHHNQSNEYTSLFSFTLPLVPSVR